MSATTTPAQRLHRVLGEGARLIAMCPGQTSIDMTPDVIALLDGVQSRPKGFEPRKESIDLAASCGDVPTLVEFT
jgi:hypothetical protein